MGTRSFPLNSYALIPISRVDEKYFGILKKVLEIFRATLRWVIGKNFKMNFEQKFFFRVYKQLVECMAI